ncbi:Aste57867_16460 [Aphanomyces stellatus]|uniref:Aste57867_16460 protein n=1 Tax=Aphanomyces stellatus TaxID=120398 RepID=A0A485L8P8_9STRA|nr:hypothetical protein As57867_016403 [Aphanomyces stellatus]VFT93234.1 Aste57867_16460 [Aphanomyces stellatus]
MQRSRDRARLYERVRKQEYRAEKRRERKLLEAQIYYLEDQIKHNIPGPARAVKMHDDATRSTTSWRELARTNLRERTAADDERRALQRLVQRRATLAQLLEAWVAQAVAPRRLGDGAAWRESTLMADPTARQYGFEWLTDRVFHCAMRVQATDAAAMGTNIDDQCHLHVHTDDDFEILGVESHCQYTLWADGADIAEALWTDSHVLTAIPGLTLTKTVVQDQSLVYVRLHNVRNGLSCCKIVRRYDLPQTTIFTYVYVRDDESFPLAATERRPHGYGWTIVHDIAPGIALARTSGLQYAPLTAQGTVVSIAETASMFGTEAHATSRETTLARIENNAQTQLATAMRLQNAAMVTQIQSQAHARRSHQVDADVVDSMAS